MDLLKREQIKYVHRPPNYSPFLAPIFGWLGDRFVKRRLLNVRKVEVEGGERVRDLIEAGHMVLVAPNHADHADPFVTSHAGRRIGVGFNYMAAREVFERQGRIGRWVLSRIGALSVDREGADIAAIKSAMGVMREGRHPLVVFPEGEIFHHHERLAPLNEGVTTILLRAMKGQPETQSAYLVPTALRYSYDPSVVDTFSPRLAALEDRITWKPRPEMDVVERIYRLGSGLLATKEVEFLGEARSGDLIERIRGLQLALVELVESKHFDEARGGTVPERVKAIRHAIRRELTDDEEDADDRVYELYDDLDTLFLAVQLYSYPGQYLSEDPTRHRIAETIMKLEEDVLGQATYPTPRTAQVRFDEPIAAQGFLESGGFTVKSGIEPMTDLLATRIQTMLEEMTAAEDG